MMKINYSSCESLHESQRRQIMSLDLQSLIIAPLKSHCGSL